MAGWMIEPSMVKSFFDISEDIGVWQDGWQLSIRSGCHRVPLMESPSGDGTSLCHVCNTKYHIMESRHEYPYVLEFGRHSWDAVDKSIAAWITYWVGTGSTGGDIEVRYSGLPSKEALYINDWETMT